LLDAFFETRFGAHLIRRSETLIVGVGSPHGDDRVGWSVTQQLAPRVASLATVRVVADPSEILHWLEGVRTLHICDACQLSGAAGRIHRWQWPDLPAEVGQAPWSSHGMTLPQTLALAESLGVLPEAVTIWGIEIAEARPAESLSAELQQVAAAVAEQIAGEIRDA
jgi:hydrogenase maturation protease